MAAVPERRPSVTKYSTYSKMKVSMSEPEPAAPDVGRLSTRSRSGLDDDDGFSNSVVRVANLAACRDMMCTASNFLLICVPLGLAAKFLEAGSAFVFTCNFLGIIPLAAILGTAAEALAQHTGNSGGQWLSKLVDASFGNAVEIIIVVSSIRRGFCGLVQAALVGSVISNLLLVLGMSFLASGILRSDQAFNKDGAGCAHSCLLVAATGLAMPTLIGSKTNHETILLLSRQCSVVLAAVYGLFLVFQLKTHKKFFNDVSQPISHGELDEAGGYRQSIGEVIWLSEDEGVAPTFSPAATWVLLFSTVMVIIKCSELMIGSVEEVSEEYGVPHGFIGLILLPMCGNAVEQSTAVLAAFKGKMDLAIGIAVGSSMQVSLLVVPFSVMIGWYLDQPMHLNFGGFFSGIFLMAVFLTASVMLDGSSNWLEGLMLIATYVMIAVISWYIPHMDSDERHDH